MHPYVPELVRLCDVIYETLDEAGGEERAGPQLTAYLRTAQEAALRIKEMAERLG